MRLAVSSRALKRRLGSRQASLGTRSHAEPALQGTDQHGFALITTLWLIAILATVVGLGLATTRLGVLTTSNRLRLTQGRWAAEACLAIAEARWVQRRLSDTATIDLGQGKTCAWRVDDPTARVNVNVGEPSVLKQLSALSRQPSADSVLHVILERRRERSVEHTDELKDLVDSAMLGLLTVDGPGSVNVNAAPAPVLAALPGMTGEAAELVLYRRSVGRLIEGLDALAGALSPAAREALLASYAELARTVTFAAPQLVVTAEGWVTEQGARNSTLRARVEVLVVPLPERLAVIRKRMG